MICYLLSVCLFVCCSKFDLISEYPDSPVHWRIFSSSMGNLVCQNMNHNFTDSACLHMCLSVCVGHLQIHNSTLLLDCLRSTIDMAAVVLFFFFFIKLHIHTVSWKTLLEFLLQCLQSRLHVEERRKVARKDNENRHIQKVHRNQFHVLDAVCVICA